MTDDFDELDLLAYADGRLTGDRAARIEARLAHDPDLAARLKDFARQDRELHAHFDRYAEDPLPERLAALFEDAPPPGRWTAARALRHAAALLLLAATGAGGWWIGHTGDTDDGRAFADAAAARYAADGPPSQAEVAGAQRMTAGEATLRRFSDKISLELRAPDLSDHGYRLVDKRRVRLDDGQPGLVLRYAGAEGDAVKVFLKSRWRAREKAMRFARRDEVTVSYWNEGPIAVAVASARRDRTAVHALAREVQTAFGRPRSKDATPKDTIPTLEPYATPPGTAQEAGAPSGNAPARSGSGGVEEVGQ